MKSSGSSAHLVGTSKPLSVQSIHFAKSDLCLHLEGGAELVSCDALCCGEFDAAGDLCVAVGSAEGTVRVFKSSVGARVWTQVAGLGCVGALLPLRAAGRRREGEERREETKEKEEEQKQKGKEEEEEEGEGADQTNYDLLLVVSAGERVVSLLDLSGGAVRKVRLEPVLEASAWAVSGQAHFALAGAGTVALYQLLYNSNNNNDKRSSNYNTTSFGPSTTLQVECRVVQCWRVEDDGGGGNVDALSFCGEEGTTLLASLSSGAVARLRPNAPIEWLRRAGTLQGWTLPARTRAMNERLLASVSLDGQIRVATENDDVLLDFSLADDAFVFSFLTSRVLRFGDEQTVTACGSNGDTWFVDSKGNVLLFSVLAGQDGSVVAFDIHKSRTTGESMIVYLLGNGDLVLFTLDLTCLECRLFSKHAETFVQRHPVFSSLNARQRSELVRLAMLYVP